MTGLERERRGGNGILNIRIVRCRFRLSALWILLNSFRLSLCRAASKESNPLEITVLQPGPKKCGLSSRGGCNAARRINNGTMIWLYEALDLYSITTGLGNARID